MFDVVVTLLLCSVRAGKTKEAQEVIIALFSAGYAATDIIQTIFRVTKSYDMPEPQKLEYIREIGFTHMRISEGLNTQLQLLGCIARMCNMVHSGKFAAVATTTPMVVA